MKRKILLLCIFILVFINISCSYFIIRDFRAEEFICEIYHQYYIYGSNELDDYYEFKKIMNTRNTKHMMVFGSIKPLKIEKWFTPDEIKRFGLKQGWVISGNKPSEKISCPGVKYIQN